jgi:hypothetical protein
VKKVVLSNLAAAAGANIDLRGKVAPIYSVISATLLAGQAALLPRGLMTTQLL